VKRGPERAFHEVHFDGSQGRGGKGDNFQKTRKQNRVYFALGWVYANRKRGKTIKKTERTDSSCGKKNSWKRQRSEKKRGGDQKNDYRAGNQGGKKKARILTHETIGGGIQALETGATEFVEGREKGSIPQRTF